MTESNVIALKDPVNIRDPLTELLRSGAKKLLHDAVEAELTEMLSGYAEHRDSSGRLQIVRNGHLPERTVQTGIGDVVVKVPRVRDRSGNGIQFRSAFLPPYLRRSKSLEELLPYLYLKGISTGDFSEALKSLLGDQAPGLSATTITRLKQVWQEEYEAWGKRDLSLKNYVYFWADGVYIHAKNDSKQCLLVIIGANELGKKEVVAIHDGYRESTQSWKELFLDLKQRGLQHAPKLAIGDGAMGFWGALQEEFPSTRQQRCWVHKTANILNHFPKAMHEKVKQNIHNIWMAEDKKSANKACDYFMQCYQDKYPKSASSLEKDRNKLLTFYDFPAKHWLSIRSTNVIESVFATVKHRTYKTKGCLSRNTALTMVFKLIMVAQNKWISLPAGKQCADIIRGVQFKNGVTLCNHNQVIQVDKDAA
jgi:putative transposase